MAGVRWELEEDRISIPTAGGPPNSGDSVNIYLKVELRRRDLEGRLLLGLVAADRGHRVVIGDFRELLSHRRWLNPGIFHDKSLTPRRNKLALHRSLSAEGFLVSSQDEEHGLGDPDYSTFAQRRFGTETLQTATTVLCWGPHDHAALSAMYPNHVDRLVLTGSPRVDLWRHEFTAPSAGSSLPNALEGQPFVLVAPGSRPFIPHSFPTAIADFRPRQFRSDDDDLEWAHYRKFSEAYLYVGRLVRALRLAARELPDVMFVVRPHPKSPDGAWEAVLGQMPNIIVSRDGTTRAWLRSATALIHNGSTTGAEAAAMRVPVISYQPHNERADRFTNRLGRVAHDESELLQLVAEAADPRRRDAWWEASSTDEVLAERLSISPNTLSADRIVDVWERHDRPGLNRPNKVGQADAISRLHRRAGTLHAALRPTSSSGRKSQDSPGLDESPKFPPLAAAELQELVGGLSLALDRFQAVTARRVTGRLFTLERQ